MKNIQPFLVFIFLLNSSLVTAQNMSLDLGGTNDYVEVLSTFGLGTTGNTTECWVNLPTTSESGAFVHIGSSNGTDNGYGIGVGGTNWDDPGNTLIVLFDMQRWVNTGVSIGTGWHHVAFSIAVDGTVTTYLDGKLIHSSPGPGPWQPTTKTTIGSSFETGRMLTDGLIDEVRIWSDIRTEAEIEANMHEELIGNEANLVAYYNFNATSGTTLTDNSSFSNTGTLTNMAGTEWIPSAAFYGPKNCLDLDGVDDNVWISSFSPTVSGTGSFSFWIKLDAIPTYNARVLSNGINYAGNTSDEVYIVNNDGRIATNNLVVGEVISSNPLSVDVWTHIAITADATGSSLYINGVLDDTGGAAAFTFDTFKIGGQFTDFNFETIDAQMDEVRVWNYVRTTSEIREDMNKSLTGNESGLVAYYNFDHPSGTTLQDYSPNNNNGELLDGATEMSTPIWIASTAFNTWLNTNSSDLATASNWSNNIPLPTDNVGINNYSGISPVLIGDPTVNNLFIGSGTGITLNSGFTVNGNLFLNDNLDLNGQTITLGGTATLYEDNGLISGSTGSITTIRNLNNINENVAGLGATITTSADMGSTTITRGHTAQTYNSNNSIKRYFDITPTNNTGLNASLTFNYDDSELNSLTESSLLLFKSTDGGTIWTNEIGIINTPNNTIFLNTIDGFSRWTAAEDLVLSLENNIIEGFSIYPNPTKDLLFINAKEEIKQAKIFNLLGQQLVEKSINSKVATLDLKFLPTGTYYILIKTHNTTKSIKFLIE